MKKSVKRILSGFIAVAMVAAMSFTVCAADYAKDPDFKTTVTDDGSKVITQIRVKNKVATVKTDSLDNVKLTADIMKDLAAGKAKTLVVESDEATISIDSAKVTKVTKLDLSMDIESTDKETVIEMKSDTDLGCEVKITVKSCKLSAEALKTAHVFCGDEDLGPVELTADGKPIITVTKGGTYTIR